MAPSMHPQAKFDPIPPDLDLHDLVDKTPNFNWVKRISAAQIRNIGQREFEKLVLFHVIQGGKPLVIEKWNDRLPKSLFGAAWLESHYDKRQENVRDINAASDIPMTTGHYLRSMKQLTNQWTPTNFRDERRQRLYLKDIDCPPEWHDRLRSILPPNSFYLNENVEQKPARRSEEMDMFPEDHVTAPAGDLMSSLPPEMRAQNLMCYIGHEGTYTPAHKEMCASLGQNIMVDASGDKNGEKPGSSIWVMTETKDREVVREYFLSMLGHDIEIEKHFAQINAWKKAAFPVYIVEQKVGDYVLVPPLAPHQVWNRGTRTVKVAWNRTTVETLEMALHEALPKARLVCRDEQYKNKAIVYFTLQKYHKELADMQETAEMGWLGIGQDLFRDSPRVQQLVKDFKALFSLYTEILVDEMFGSKEKDVEYIEFDSNITCSYCRANIFNRFLTCKHCVRQLADGDEDTYDVCVECYAMGRSCLCISGLSWCEQWKWSELVGSYETWRAMVIRNDAFVDLDASPMPLEIARRKYGKKPVAQICQEQLRRRPWKDISKHEVPSDPEPSEPEVDADGRPLKKKPRRKKKKGDIHRCHVCSHKDYVYRLAFCSTPGCTEAYCYGVLYRAFDLMPQTIMQNERWKCPKCLNICNCGHCRRQKLGNPYMPKNTLLGHDTRPIADDRSVESLVDFRLHNLGWLKNAGDDSRNIQSKRMQRLRQAAEAEKARDGDLVNDLPALPNGDEAAGPDSTTQRPETNGYDDESHALGPGIMGEYGMALPVREAPPEPQQPVINDIHPPTAPMADMSLGEDTSLYPDPSSYPDPSMLGHERMLGMGYYQQDDSPDKILFDPYQIPSVEAMVEDGPEISEYAKKALRAAKRRVRLQEDDDPDFAAPRSHHRKRARLDLDDQSDGQQDAPDNMDPALFAQDSTMLDAPAEPEVMEEAGQAEQSPDTASIERLENRSISPHRPALRASRPIRSYAEPEAGEDEFSEVVSEGDKGAPPPPGITDFNPEDADRDPLDLASAAIRAIAQTSDEPDKATETAAPARVKRRGPGRPRKSDVNVSRTSDHVPEKETTKGTRPAGPGRRRGRPSRSAMNEEPMEPLVHASVESRQTSLDPTIEELEAQLARELEAFDENGEQIEPIEPIEPIQQAPDPRVEETQTPPARKRPGRPRRSIQAEPQEVPQTKATAPVKATPQAKAKPPVKVTPQATPTARPKIKTVTVEIRSIRAPPPPPDLSLLSMKERMALKGKKFKIAKRKSEGATSTGDKDTGSAASTPGGNRGAKMAGSRSVTKSEGRSVMSHNPAPSPGISDYRPPTTEPPSPVPPPQKSSGPTIVRLGDSEDEYESGALSSDDGQDDGISESSSDFDGEEDDIPAHKTPVRIANRGLRMAIRASTRGGRGGRFARRGRR